MSLNHKLSSIIVFACLCMQLSPGWAQSTVLTGKVATTNRTKLINQNARYDTPVTTVRTSSAIVSAPQQRISAPAPVVTRPVYQTVYVRDNRTFFQRHPKVKAATVGAGVGTAAGAVTGLISGRGVVRGAAIGAGTGAGVGLVRSSNTMKRHPIVKNVTTGTLVGLGVGAAASRGHRRALQGAGIGAAVGLGASLLKGDLR
ncbi:MAG: glycine zipper family protein [Candidatus Obscuribacterales bacterium]|nr:glycine zipper family protein [Candidatus Obscuribacterales bacterium]